MCFMTLSCKNICNFRVHRQIHPTDFLLITYEMAQSAARLLSGAVAGELNVMCVTMAAASLRMFWQT